MGANDGEGDALAQFARDQGIGRLAIVHDDDGYGRTIALHAGRAARRLGIGVAGPYRVRLTWGGTRARALARRVARDRPDGLLYAGVPSWGPLQKEKPGFALVREVRRRLGNDMPVLGPDSWAVGPEAFEGLGRWARNIHLSVPGVPLERLGPAGRRFVAEFRETQPGGIVTSDAVYFAQATELLLAAIARSDGSRSSVTRAAARHRRRGRAHRRRPLRRQRRHPAAAVLDRPRHAPNRHRPRRAPDRRPGSDHRATVTLRGYSAPICRISPRSSRIARCSMARPAASNRMTWHMLHST